MPKTALLNVLNPDEGRAGCHGPLSSDGPECKKLEMLDPETKLDFRKLGHMAIQGVTTRSRRTISDPNPGEGPQLGIQKTMQLGTRERREVPHKAKRWCIGRKWWWKTWRRMALRR